MRTLEARAREANGTSGPRSAAGRQAAHPDQQVAAEQIADALGAALGIEVTVRPRGDGYRVELAFDDPAEALALARRLRPRAVA